MEPLVARFALNLKYISSTAYRAVCKGGIINLHAERTLSDCTHWASVCSGAQVEFIEHFKFMLEDQVSSSEMWLCAISMDEMKIKNGLVFSKTSGHLVGLVDLDSANREIERLMEEVACSTNGRLADQMSVFLARGVFKPSLTVPVAHYPSLKLSSMLSHYSTVWYRGYLKYSPCAQVKKSFLLCGKLLKYSNCLRFR